MRLESIRNSLTTAPPLEKQKENDPKSGKARLDTNTSPERNGLPLVVTASETGSIDAIHDSSTRHTRPAPAADKMK